MIALLAISSAVQSNELNNLIDSSGQIVQQLNRSIMLVGSAQEYAHTGSALSDGTLHLSAQIDQDLVQDYNSALSNMVNYLPYGSVQDVLNERASEEISMMNDAVDTFTEVVVEMSQVVQVAEMAESASSPDEQAQVQNFVIENESALTITPQQFT
jgi:hypothetical protein